MNTERNWKDEEKEEFDNFDIRKFSVKAFNDFNNRKRIKNNNKKRINFKEIKSFN